VDHGIGKREFIEQGVAVAPSVKVIASRPDFTQKGAVRIR
jgi:hypothetical protein